MLFLVENDHKSIYNYHHHHHHNHQTNNNKQTNKQIDCFNNEIREKGKICNQQNIPTDPKKREYYY